MDKANIEVAKQARIEAKETGKLTQRSKQGRNCISAKQKIGFVHTEETEAILHKERMKQTGVYTQVNR